MMQASPTARSCGLQCRLPYGLMCSHIPPSTARLPVRPGDLQSNVPLPQHSHAHLETCNNFNVHCMGGAGQGQCWHCRNLYVQKSHNVAVLMTLSRLAALFKFFLAR